tara:strand:- start:4705 stop:4902 length:198 start_codon:yes stop_codon:yes gene_type:complete
MRTVTLADFLTETELKLVAKLKEAKSICDQVIQPNIERINKAIGQQNDPMHLSYMCEYAVSQGGV